MSISFYSICKERLSFAEEIWLTDRSAVVPSCQGPQSVSQVLLHCIFDLPVVGICLLLGHLQVVD